MPRSRGTELPQRNSPRVPLHLKTTVCAVSNGVNHHSRSMVDRSPKLHDHRSPRSSSPFHEKKRGTRVSDLETKLSKAQEELKKLREQLVSAESAKKDAQTALETAKKHVSKSESVVTQEEEVKEESKIEEVESKIQDLDSKEPEGKELVEPKVEEESLKNSPPLNIAQVYDVSEEDKENINENATDELTKEEKEEEVAMKIIEEAMVIQEEPEEELKQESKSENPETVKLNLKLAERDEQVRHLTEEYSEMKKKAEEAMERANKMEEGMRVAEAAKQALEGEMRRLRVQTDQWRKAAEEAASVLARVDGDVFEGRRSGARCGPLDGNNGSNGGFGYGWGSPVIAEEDEGRRRGGMRMFGELWKKKGGP